MSHDITEFADPPSSVVGASHTDDLDAVLQSVWALLARGVADRRSPFHTPSVATLDRDGAPATRTVVLRGVDAKLWSLRFHTDRRSSKFASLSCDPRIAVLAYDARSKVQVRASGIAHLHTDDDVAEAAWRNSRPSSRQCYAQVRGPGTPVANPADAFPPQPENDTTGRENFAAVVVHVRALEWLYLQAGGHRRARFERKGAAASTACWLAP